MLEEVGVGGRVGGEDVVEGGGDAVGVVVAVEGDLAASGDADVAEGDVAEGRGRAALERAVGGVAGVEGDGVGGVTDADVVVGDVADETAAGAVGFDAEAVVRAVEGEVGDEDVVDAAVGLAADGHAVSVVEVVVGDGHVGDGVTTFDGDVVVAGADEAVGDGDVFGAAGVDTVGVAGSALGRVDAEAPDGEAVAMVVDDVEVGGVFKGDAVEGEVVGVVGDKDAGDLLTSGGAGLFGEIPPGDGSVEEGCAAASVDGAFAHDSGSGDVFGGEEGLAAVAFLVDEAAASGGGLVEFGVAGGEEDGVFFDEEGDVGSEFEGAGEEGVVSGVGAEGYGVASGAVVESFLDAGGVEFCLVLGRDGGC